MDSQSFGRKAWCLERGVPSLLLGVTNRQWLRVVMGVLSCARRVPKIEIKQTRSARRNFIGLKCLGEARSE